MNSLNAKLKKKNEILKNNRGRGNDRFYQCLLQAVIKSSILYTILLYYNHLIMSKISNVEKDTCHKKGIQNGKWTR